MYLVNSFTIILLPFIGTLIGQQNSDELLSSQVQELLQEECCKRKAVNGHVYNLVEENGVVPSNCSTSCVYEMSHKPGSRFCFSPGQQESECLPETQTYIPILNNQTESRGSQHGCVPLKDLPKKDNYGRYICMYYWNGKNIGAGGKKVTGCQGSQNHLINHYRMPVQPGNGYIPMGSIAVMPGCSLYMYNGNSGYEGTAGQLKVLPNGYVYQNTWGPSGGNYPPGPRAVICECEQDTISCTPSDGYDTLVTCDNRLGTLDTTCSYQFTTGITHSSSLTAEQEMSLTVKEEEEVTLEGIFKESGSIQFTTGFKWTEATTETFTESKTITVTDNAPAGKVLVIQQAVGHCAGRKVQTNMIKTIIQDTL